MSTAPASPTDGRERWAREDAREAKEMNARALAVSVQESAKEILRLRREQEAKESQWNKWDRLLAASPFEEYLQERGLCVRAQWNQAYIALDAEAATLGAMLMDAEAIAVTVRMLDYRAFHFTHHQQIFQCAEQAWRRALATRQAQGKTLHCDVIVIVEELRRCGWLASSGGRDYLSALIEGCPGPANVAAYADAVLEAAQRRVLLDAARVLMPAVAENDGVRWSAAKAGAVPLPLHPPERLLAALRKFCDGVDAMRNAAPPPDLSKILEEMK